MAQQKMGDRRALTHRARFGETTLTARFVLDADGKIAGVGFSPE